MFDHVSLLVLLSIWVDLTFYMYMHVSANSKLGNQIASWDTKFETGTKAALLLPFSPIVVAADENERIR